MPPAKVSAKASDLLQHLRKGDLRALARAITLVENSLPEADALLEGLRATARPGVVGITGPPGAGKSTLVNALVAHWLEQGLRIAVVAVDPSSPFNLGALLGDRIRMAGLFTHPRVYIRSLASRGALGGLHPSILQVTDLLREAPFDRIVVETVGVGQSEVEIAGLADCTVVITVPEGGDEVQMMKSGVLEVADILVVNKGDRPQADAMVKRLRTMAHERNQGGADVPVLKTVATENGQMDALAQAIETVLIADSRNRERQKMLLTEKILQLAASRILQKTDRKALAQQVETELAQGTLNIYREAEQLVKALHHEPNK